MCSGRVLLLHGLLAWWWEIEHRGYHVRVDPSPSVCPGTLITLKNKLWSAQQSADSGTWTVLL